MLSCCLHAGNKHWDSYPAWLIWLQLRTSDCKTVGKYTTGRLASLLRVLQ
jgi:hypothetical protein